MIQITIASQAFQNVFLRMDGTDVIPPPTGPGSGIVNCQYKASTYEQFNLLFQADGTVAFGSVHFSGVYLRMDGSGVNQPISSGGGVINCQSSIGPYEKFRLIGQGDGSTAIESVEFPGVFLRMDGTGVTKPVAPGGGVVNCQFGVSTWEKFYLNSNTAA